MDWMWGSSPQIEENRKNFLLYPVQVTYSTAVSGQSQIFSSKIVTTCFYYPKSLLVFQQHVGLVFASICMWWKWVKNTLFSFPPFSLFKYFETLFPWCLFENLNLHEDICSWVGETLLSSKVPEILYYAVPHFFLNSLNLLLMLFANSVAKHLPRSLNSNKTQAPISAADSSQLRPFQGIGLD